MTNYNERLDEVLDSYAGYYNLQDINRFTKEQMSIEFPHLMTKDKAKQAITSLIKELVEEAKPQEHIDVHTYSNARTNGDIRKIAIDQFEQNLLKALEEV